MVAHRVAGDSSVFLTLTRLTPNDCWSGSQQTFLCYFAEQAHTYNDLSSEPHNLGQLVQYLRASDEGAPNLAKVATIYERSMHTDTFGINICFNECLKPLN